MAAVLFPDFNAFLDAEHAGASTLGLPAGPVGLLTTSGNWFIFGTKYETLGRDAPGAGAVALADTNMIIKDFGVAPLLAAVGAKAPGTWGGFNPAVTAAGLIAKPIFPEYGNLSITDTITAVRMHTTAAAGIIDGRDASLVNVIVGNNMPAAGGVVYTRLAQLALPDVVANAAARDLIAAISKPTFDKQVIIYLNQRSICCKTFYDFICKITDIIYDKKRINIWYERALVVNGGVKGAMADLKCDGVALTCKNGLSTAKHSVFTEELSYMYSEVVRLITNHHNMLNSGFATPAVPNLAAVTPLETALNKFKNFLAVLLRYDYLIRGDTNSRKERFRVQAADALLKGVRYMADGNPGLGFENYLYTTSPSAGRGLGGGNAYATFFSAGGANAKSFFPVELITKITAILAERGNIPVADLRNYLGGAGAVGTNIHDGLMRGISWISTTQDAAGVGAATNAGGDDANQGAVGAAAAAAGGSYPDSHYHDIFPYNPVGGNAFDWTGGGAGTCVNGRLNGYYGDMSIVGPAEEIWWTCERIADPIGRYGIGLGVAATAGAAPEVLNPAAKGLTYNQFMLLLLTQLMKAYDDIVFAENGNVVRGNADVLPTAAAANIPFVDPANPTSLLARTYYMSNFPAMFMCAVGAATPNLLTTLAAPDAVIPAVHETPISQSIVRWFTKCTE